MTNFTTTTNPKGTHMPDREQSPKHTAKTPSHRTGIFATLRALLRAKGTGAPSSRRTPIALVTGLIAIAAFAITAAPASASVEMISVSEVSYASAQVKGKVVTDDSIFGTAYTFEYSTDPANKGWTPGPGGFLGASPPNRQVEGKLENLKGATKYFVRLTTAVGAISPEPYPSFTTLPVDPPSVTSIDNASDVAYTTATVKGKVNRPANADPAFNVDCHFQYVTDKQFNETGFTENPGDVPCEGTNPIETPGANEVEAHLTGLANDTAYHLRLFASNASPTTDAKEAAATFKTLKVDPPSVKSIEDATEVEYTTAQVKGVVERPATSEDPAFDITGCNFEAVSDKQFNDNPPGDKFAGATAVACEAPEFPIHAEGETDVEAKLTGLAGGTEYHLRLSASNLGGSNAKEAAATFTTLAVDPPSVLAIGNATGIDQDSATVSGEISRPDNPDPAFDVDCHFQYVTDEQFKATGFANPGEAICEPKAEPAENPIHTAGPSEVNAKLTGLTPETTYHLRLFASNPGGSDSKEAAQTFTTTQNFPASAVVGPITEISYGGAKLSGEVDADGWPHFFYPTFELSTDGDLWNIFVPTGGGGGVKLGPVTPVVVTGLKGATKYFVRLKLREEPLGIGEGQLAISQPPYPSFTTLPVDPGVVLKANDASDVSAESAKVSGEIERPANPDPAFDTNCRFEYVTDAQFDANGFQVAGQTPCGIDPLSTPEEKRAVEVELTGIKSGTEYHVRLTATNAGPDASLEAANTFTTVAVPATATQTAGGSDGEAGYVLSGLVNPHNSTISDCKFVYGPDSDLDYKKYAFAIDCSPTPDAVNKPVSVEGHVTGLTPDNEYHSRLVVTNAFGTVVTPDQSFVPTLDPPEDCPNHQLRKENNSSGLPECRAYEQVSPQNKNSGEASLNGFTDDGNAVGFGSATNFGEAGNPDPLYGSSYRSERGESGWKVKALVGPLGSFHAGPDGFSSSPQPIGGSLEFGTSLWAGSLTSHPAAGGSFLQDIYLRWPDGTFTLVGKVPPTSEGQILGGRPIANSDLSHVFLNGRDSADATIWGLGVYEFVGTGNGDKPRRVDVDNTGAPISSCVLGGQGSGGNSGSAFTRAISADGHALVFAVFGGCGGSNPPADELWARVDGTTSYDITASLCTRGDCNAPANAAFVDVTPDGSRVFFRTTQQLLNGDTDQTDDIYACDLPTTPQAPVGKANPCAALTEVSGARSGAEVESVPATSEDGSTVYFTARGVLADNEDALGDTAAAGDRNLYVWRQDEADPLGQTLFVARLPDEGVDSAAGELFQTTPDGRYLVFGTLGVLLPTDTDNARDVYRYDAEAAELTRVSFGTSGSSGNAGGFDASLSNGPQYISDDGQAIAFTTSEPLSPLDGNGSPDVYLWSHGRVFRITGGAKGGSSAGVSASGADVFFSTREQLIPSDGDQGADVYDARVEGGFSQAEPERCSGETCQPDATPAPAKQVPNSAQPGPGNPPPPKPCPKGKVLKGKKCVKKNKKHNKKKNKGHGKRASHNRGGNK